MLQKRKKKNACLIHYLGQPSRLRYGVTIVVLCSFFITSCGYFYHAPSAQKRAENVISHLESIDDPKQREAATVFTLNALCTMSRLASGLSEGRVENAMSGYFMNRTPEVKAEIRKLGETLNAIPATKRAELLGSFAKHDPGSCSNAPDWDGVKRSVILSHRMIPRLRTNFCSGNLAYGDATVADRAITVGSKIIATSIDEGDPNVVAALASPVILGIEGSSHVTARHPDLAASDNEEGISPYGVVTDIPCSDMDDSGCDPNRGLVCGTKLSGPPQCVAFPVVQKDQDLVLRGYNFWDVEEPKLLFTPLIPGEGSESTARLSMDGGVDANEPTDGAAACPVPTPDNPTHNRAHFRVIANEGHFYQLQMYNHNGHFFTQRDAQDHEDPRILHACYPESLAWIPMLVF